MSRITLSIMATLAITYVVAFLVYGTFSAVVGLQPPQGGTPAEFLVSVLVVKLGLAIGFVLLFCLAREYWAGRWLTYALIWWITFALTEIGQAIGPDYSEVEALAGIIAEGIYCPLAGLATARLLREPRPARA